MTTQPTDNQAMCLDCGNEVETNIGGICASCLGESEPDDSPQMKGYVIKVDDKTYLCAFNGSEQNIQYININDVFDSGKFSVQHGWIVSLEPADFLIEFEMQDHLKQKHKQPQETL